MNTFWIVLFPVNCVQPFIHSLTMKLVYVPIQGNLPGTMYDLPSPPEELLNDMRTPDARSIGSKGSTGSKENTVTATSSRFVEISGRVSTLSNVV